MGCLKKFTCPGLLLRWPPLGYFTNSFVIRMWFCGCTARWLVTHHRWSTGRPYSIVGGDGPALHLADEGAHQFCGRGNKFPRLCRHCLWWWSMVAHATHLLQSVQRLIHQPMHIVHQVRDIQRSLAIRNLFPHYFPFKGNPGDIPFSVDSECAYY